MTTTSYYTFTYYYGNGDSYSGYGFADAGTYSPYSYVYSTAADPDFYNETFNYGYYYISDTYEYGYDLGSSYQGLVYVTSYYDGGSDYDGYGSPSYGSAYSAYGSTNGGLGSESGYAYNSSYSNSDSYISTYSSADLATGDQYFNYATYADPAHYDLVTGQSANSSSLVANDQLINGMVTAQPYSASFSLGPDGLTASAEPLLQQASEEVFIYAATPSTDQCSVGLSAMTDGTADPFDGSTYAMVNGYCDPFALL
jgi:hypothetical protein